MSEIDKKVAEERINRIAYLYQKIDDFVDNSPIKLTGNVAAKIKEVLLGDKEIKELINSIKEKRIPRLVLVGSTGAGKSSLLNALAGQYLSKTSAVVPGTKDTLRIAYSTNGKEAFEIIDTRGISEPLNQDQVRNEAEEQLKKAFEKFQPDAILFVQPASVRAHINDEIEELKKIFKLLQRDIPLIVVLTKADDLEPQFEKDPAEYSERKLANIETAVNQMKSTLSKHEINYIDVIPVSTLIEWDRYPEDVDKSEWVNLNIKRDYRYNIVGLIKLLESNIDLRAAITLLLNYKANMAVKKVAKNLVALFSNIAATIALSPLPGSDLPFLCGLQACLVSCIIYLSGKEPSMELCRDFILGVGVVGAVGFICKVAVQQIGKLLNVIPLAGEAVSALAARQGTQQIGEAAIKHFIDGELI